MKRPILTNDYLNQLFPDIRNVNQELDRLNEKHDLNLEENLKDTRGKIVANYISRKDLPYCWANDYSSIKAFARINTNLGYKVIVLKQDESVNLKKFKTLNDYMDSVINYWYDFCDFIKRKGIKIFKMENIRLKMFYLSKMDFHFHIITEEWFKKYSVKMDKRFYEDLDTSKVLARYDPIRYSCDFTFGSGYGLENLERNMIISGVSLKVNQVLPIARYMYTFSETKLELGAIIKVHKQDDRIYLRLGDIYVGNRGSVNFPYYEYNDSTPDLELLEERFSNIHIHPMENRTCSPPSLEDLSYSIKSYNFVLDIPGNVLWYYQRLSTFTDKDDDYEKITINCLRGQISKEEFCRRVNDISCPDTGQSIFNVGYRDLIFPDNPKLTETEMLEALGYHESIRDEKDFYDSLSDKSNR